jgi:hypothetical protein
VFLFANFGSIQGGAIQIEEVRTDLDNITVRSSPAVTTVDHYEDPCPLLILACQAFCVVIQGPVHPSCERIVASLSKVLLISEGLEGEHAAWIENFEEPAGLLKIRH